MRFTLDETEWKAAAAFVIKATGKAEEEILNRSALHAVIGGKGVRGAMQRTPKADKAKIRALSSAELAASVARRNHGRKFGPGEFARAIKKERARRIRSSGYTAFAGWSKAAQAFGGKGVRGVQSGFGQSKASRGFGSRAKSNDLVAEIANTAPAAEKIGFAPLQYALNDVARDLVEYGTRKIQQTFDKVNAK